MRPGRKPRAVTARAVGTLDLTPEVASAVAALLWEQERAAPTLGAGPVPGVAGQVDFTGFNKLAGEPMRESRAG